MTALLLLASVTFLATAAAPATLSVDAATTVEQVRRFDPLDAVWPMEVWAARARARHTAPRRLLRYLDRALASDPQRAMTESLAHTPSAAEAWRDRSANCLGLALLVIALGRAAGLDLVMVEERGDAELEARAGVRIAHRHVAAAWAEADGFWVLDFGGLARRPPTEVRTLDDHQARGLYYANRGAEALLAGRAARAVPWLEAAVELVEEDWVWRNLALALLRSGRPAAATAARQRARVLSDSPSKN